MTRRISATPARVYRALTEPADVKAWMVPDGMTSEVHEFVPRVGGRFRISLTYDGGEVGKSDAHTDTYSGRFVELVPERRVVQEMEFETDRADLRGVMTTLFELADVNGDTELTAEHHNVPEGIPLADNELGWRLSLDKLARLVERQ